MPLLRSTALILFATLLVGLLSLFLHPRAPVWQSNPADGAAITAAELRQSAIQPIWVDARSAGEFSSGHIPGAIRLAEDDWEAGLSFLLDLWQPGAWIVVYCGGEACQASKAVAMRLQREFGFEHIHYLQGDWREW